MKQSFEICLWKRRHSQKLVRFHVKTSLFPSYFEMLLSLLKVIVFFYVTFYSMMYFRRLLLLSCFYGSSQCFFKVKITFKRVNFIKKENPIQLCMSLISYRSFLLWSIFSPFVDIQLKWLNRLCWAYLRLIFFRVNW